MFVTSSNASLHCHDTECKEFSAGPLHTNRFFHLFFLSTYIWDNGHFRTQGCSTLFKTALWGSDWDTPKDKLYVAEAIGY